MSPSFDHDSVVDLFRRQPLLAAELLANLPGLDLHATAATVLGADLTTLRPTERRADAVIKVTTTGAPVVIIGEVQLQPDPDKPWVWPLYVTLTRDRKRCTVLLVVITFDEATATWARKPIPLGNPGSTWAPIVIGPGQIPVVTSSTTPLAFAELAVLSALAHGHGERAEEVGVAAMQLVLNLDDERVDLYTDIILWALADRARDVLEALLTQPHEYKSEFARKYYGKSLEAIKEEGREEGTEEGGRTILVRLLQRRFGPLPEWVSSRLEEANIAQIEAWADAIFDAPTLEVLLALPG